MPIEPVDPSKKTEDGGREKYTPDEKRGPGKFDEILERAKVERAKAEVSEMAEKTRAKAEAERPRTYTERLQDMGRLPKTGGGGAMPKSNRDITKNFKAGGSASSRADGCCIRGKTRGTIKMCGGGKY